MDDAEAVSLARVGDRSGAEALVARYQMSVYNLTLRMLGNAADAEDATQEVFLRALQRLDQYRPAEPFGAWLHGISRHHSIDVLRRRTRRLDPGPPPTVPDAESIALRRLERERIQAALNRLSTRDRSLLVLRYWEDQSIESIARALRMTQGATKVALLRARQALGGVLTRVEVPADAV